MVASLIIGVGGIVGLMLAWILVQHWWGDIFQEYLEEEDVMAGRSSCSNCGCTTVCEKKQKQFF